MTMQSDLQQAIALDLEERTNALWSYVREFRHSLDSERGCRMIREGFDAAVEAVVTAIEPLVLKLEEAEDSLRQCRKEMKTADDSFLKRSIAIRKQINELQKENERLRAELDSMKPSEVNDGMS